MVHFHYDARPQALANCKFLYGPETEILTTWSEEGFQTLVMSLDLNTDIWKCAIRGENTYSTLELATAAIHKLSASKVSERLLNRSTYERKPLWTEVDGGDASDGHFHRYLECSSNCSFLRPTMNDQRRASRDTEYREMHLAEAETSDGVDTISSVVETRDHCECCRTHDTCVTEEPAIEGSSKQSAFLRQDAFSSFFAGLIKRKKTKQMDTPSAIEESILESTHEHNQAPMPVELTSDQDEVLDTFLTPKNKKNKGEKDLISDCALNEEPISTITTSPPPATTMVWSIQEMRAGLAVEVPLAEESAEEAVGEEPPTDIVAIELTEEESPAEIVAMELAEEVPRADIVAMGSAEELFPDDVVATEWAEEVPPADIAATEWAEEVPPADIAATEWAEEVPPADIVATERVEETCFDEEIAAEETSKANDVAPTSSPVKNEGSVAKKGSKKSRKGKAKIIDPPPPPAPMEESITAENNTWGGWGGWGGWELGSAEKEKAKIIDPPPPPAPMEETTTAEDEIWARWGAVSRKKPKKAKTKEVFDIPLPPAAHPEVGLAEAAQELVPVLEKIPVEMSNSPGIIEEVKLVEDDAGWGTAATKKYKTMKAKSAKKLKHKAVHEIDPSISAAEEPKVVLKDLAQPGSSSPSNSCLAKTQDCKRYDVYLKIGYKNRTYRRLASLPENTRGAILDQAGAYLEQIIQLDPYERDSMRVYNLVSAGGKNDLIDLSSLAGGDLSDHLEFVVQKTSSIFPELSVEVIETGRKTGQQLTSNEL